MNKWAINCYCFEMYYWFSLWVMQTAFKRIMLAIGQGRKHWGWICGTKGAVAPKHLGPTNIADDWNSHPHPHPQIVERWFDWSVRRLTIGQTAVSVWHMTILASVIHAASQQWVLLPLPWLTCWFLYTVCLRSISKCSLSLLWNESRLISSYPPESGIYVEYFPPQL